MNIKKLKRNAVITGSVLFIAGNLYLTFKEDSKAERTQWVTEWNPIAIKDVVESFQTSGVITPAEVTPVYFNQDQGSFQKFLVEEGQVINASDPLFEYSSVDIERQLTKLEAEKAETQQKITFVEQQISQFQGILNDLERETKKTNDKNNNENKDEDSGLSAITMMEKEIINQETEKKNLEEEVRKYEKLISQLESNKSNLVVKSDVEGVVKNIDEELKNPLITIHSPNPAVQGVLNEQQMRKVSEGLKIKAAVTPLSLKMEGTISNLQKFPEQEPSVKRKSLYPFTAQLNQTGDAPTADLLPGMKSNVTIITNEALQAITVPESSVVKTKKKSYVYVLNKKGLIEKRPIEKGLLVNGVQEVKNGLKKGEIIITDPSKLQTTKAHFTTSVQKDLLQKKALKKLSTKERIKFILTGILS
ncbi:RND transporter [Bacillus sp. REN10]|uniref:efflux RND transporter periplasmic adaptor subunit n=1 Tax=Bacillus sp. REN10 TaxID=2782541 RepID=UPI00193B4646|nr:RND transporter [Bacillus sp. REN10]